MPTISIKLDPKIKWKMNDFLKLIRYTNEDDLNDKLKKKINEQIEKTSVHTKICNDNCKCNISRFLDLIPYGSIRLDIFKYIIDEKLIDITNAEFRNRFLIKFGCLLENSGMCNTDEQCERIRETTLFLFPYLEKYISEFRNPIYNESLIHFAFYGYYEERKIEYVNRILDLGCPLTLKYQFDKNNKTDSEMVSQMDKIIEKNGLKIEYFGQSPIYLAGLNGYEDLLVRMLNMDLLTVNFHLKTYCISYDCRNIHEDRYKFYPIIPGILERYSKFKDPKLIDNLAAMIKLLIKHGYDIFLPIYYGNSSFTHTITDFLNYYGYVYQDSPVMKVFADLCITLPEQKDPEYLNFKEIIYRNGDNAYVTVMKKYRYLKDPSKYHIILEELENLLKNNVRCHDWFEPEEEMFIPGLQEFVGRLNEFERQEQEAFMRQSSTDSITEGVQMGLM